MRRKFRLPIYVSLVAVFSSTFLTACLSTTGNPRYARAGGVGVGNTGFTDPPGQNAANPAILILTHVKRNSAEPEVACIGSGDSSHCSRLQFDGGSQYSTSVNLVAGDIQGDSSTFSIEIRNAEVVLTTVQAEMLDGEIVVRSSEGDPDPAIEVEIQK